jgi:glycosyltransferase involved in cell wall biosynthesis
MSEKLPKVSCYMATYGRPWLVEESLESFLRQDYKGEKELVILNDYGDQTLVFDHPEVKVFNRSEQIKPLGKKFNETVHLCTGEILFPWEDDDIFLPNKLTYTVNNLVNGFFHTGLAFFETELEKLIVSGNYFHCNMAMSRDIWQKSGYYKETDQCDIDIDMMSKARNAAAHIGHTIPIEDIFYVYRWGTTGSTHASGLGTGENVRASDFHADLVKRQVDEGKIVNGIVTLKPHWRYDYIAASKLAIKAWNDAEEAKKKPPAPQSNGGPQFS